MIRFLLNAVMLNACLAGMAMAVENPPAGMVRIPKGDYSPLFRGKDDPSVTRVPAFYLDVRPVTNAEFLGFVSANPKWRRSNVSALFAEAGYLGYWSGDLELGPRASAGSPVVQVSWFAARAYAHWRGLRLPTISEWERAASAGFASENGAAEPAFQKAMLDWLSVPTLSPLPAAGSGRPDVHGVRDLGDLVWEWVDDFNATPIGDVAGDNPGLDKNLFCGAGGADARDFTNYPAFARAAFRSSLGAGYVVPNLGFRCAKCAKELVPAAPLSNTSVYQLDAIWTDDAGRPVRLASLRGRAVVLTMFFTSCGYACPIVVNKMQRIRDALPSAARARARFVLVSFDSELDTPAALHLYRGRMRLGTGWALLHGEPEDVRELAMILGVKYAKDSRGQFAHSNLITVLDPSGEIAYQQAGFEDDISADIQAVALAAQRMPADK